MSNQSNKLNKLNKLNQSNKSNHIYNKKYDEVCKNLDLIKTNFPKEIKISTMTTDAKIDVKFNATNIYKYIRTSPNGITKIKQASNFYRYTDSTKTKVVSAKFDKSSKSSEEFLNQVTVYVRVSQKLKNKPISVKIFSNGTLHFTGVISIESMLEAASKIFEECKRERFIFVNNKPELISFVDDPKDLSKLDVSNMYDFAVTMVNCIFKVPFKVDRPKLLVSLSNDDYHASYDSNGHSAVNIKYKIQNEESISQNLKVRDVNDLGKNKKRVTVFIFESGSIIIILGNQGFRPINEVYTFVYKYLLENYDSIVKDSDITEECIRQYLKASEHKFEPKFEHKFEPKFEPKIEPKIDVKSKSNINLKSKLKIKPKTKKLNIKSTR